MNDFDAIVIGGGHNGLTCAANLADAGLHTLVLEAAGQVGGLARTREFHPGFRASVAHTLPQLDSALVRRLELEKYGFSLAERSLPTVALAPDGRYRRFGPGVPTGIGSKDSANWREFQRRLSRYAEALRPFWHKSPPMAGSGKSGDLATLGQFAWRLRTLGREDMREFMRTIFLPAQDLVDEFFDDELLKAALSWDANLGSKLAPRSPYSAIIALLYRMSGDLADEACVPLPQGGAGALTDALATCATARGAEIRCGTPANRILVEQAAAVGVELTDGEILKARVIVSNLDPKSTFNTLLGAQHLEIGFSHRINRLRTDGMVAKLHLALSELPEFGELGSPRGRLLLAPDMSYLENAFDAAKYGDFAAELPMEVIVPSLYDNSLAPNGRHVLSAHVQYVPYRVSGGWQERKPELLENCLATLEQFAPGIREQVIASELLTPVDLEQAFGVTGGHWHHGEYALDNWWMNRPTYGASQYRTPLPGLFLCGAGAHPGGGIMGAAGCNAARAILKENS